MSLKELGFELVFEGGPDLLDLVGSEATYLFQWFGTARHICYFLVIRALQVDRDMTWLQILGQLILSYDLNRALQFFVHKGHNQFHSGVQYEW